MNSRKKQTPPIHHNQHLAHGTGCMDGEQAGKTQDSTEVESSLRSVIPLTSLSLKKKCLYINRKQRQEDEACKARLGLVSMNFFQRNEAKIFLIEFSNRLSNSQSTNFHCSP